MRRWLCVVQIGVLAVALWPAIAAASSLDTFDPQPIDLSAQLFARCFGESSDRQASIEAFAGDRLAETPLRDLALRVDQNVASETIVAVAAPTVQLPALPSPSVTLSDAAFAPPSQITEPVIAGLNDDLRVPAVEYYEDAAPVPTDAPATHRFALSRLEVGAPQFSQYAGSAISANAPSAQGESVKLPVQIGRVSFAPHAEAAGSTLGAGATLDVRAGARRLGLDLSSALEHVTLTAPQFSTSSASAPSLSGANLPVFVPAYANVSAQTLSTGVTVPVTRSLTANVSYDTQHLLGAYGLPGVSNLDANNTIYGAQLTYNLFKGSSAISLSAHQYRFQDNLLPANGLTQTNTNLNFTIKF